MQMDECKKKEKNTRAYTCKHIVSQ